MNDRIEMQGLFQTLAREHGLILRVLDAFERFILNVEAGAAVDAMELGRFVTFFREFIDLTHHEREETVLFPVLVEHGFADKYGPLAHIREQHDKEREFLWQLMRAFVQGELSDAEASRNLAKVATNYVRFQRAHIEKESTLLYPAARQEMKAADIRRLAADCARFESGGHRASRSWLNELGESLASQRSVASKVSDEFLDSMSNR